MFPKKRLLLALGLCAVSTSLGRAARADDPKPGDPPAAGPNEDEARGRVGYGVGLIQALTPEQKKELHVEQRPNGLVVTGVTPGSPAQKAGIKPGDVVMKVNADDIPDTSKIGKDDAEARTKWMTDEFGRITHKIKPGDTVTIVVDRDGRTETVKAVAIPKAEMDKLEEEALKDSQAVQVPEPSTGGAPAAGTYAFEGVEEGSLPADFLNVIGFSEVALEEGATPANHVLHQHTEVANPYEVAIATGAGHAYADGTVTTRFFPQGGEQSVSGGLAFRVGSWRNFYAAIADGVTRTLSIVVVKAGAEPKVVASLEIPSFKLKKWHTISVTFAGPKMSAVFDDGAKVEGTDATFSDGWAGPCNRLDADTLYDDLKLAPAK